ncbi:MAG: nucleotidyltransferase domain-containing protein [Myxococcota bacterium]
MTGRLREALGAHPEVVCAYLFGSVARGESGPASDVDVAVILREPVPERPFGYEAALSSELGAALGRSDVDIVRLDRAPPLLAQRVLRDGVLLLCRDESARIEFEVATRRRYFDTRPLREIQYRYL